MTFQGAFPQRITRRREGPGTRNSYGEWVRGVVSEQVLKCSVQPVRDEEDDQEAGTLTRSRIRVWLAGVAALRPASGSSPADIVLYGGREYEVVESKTWSGTTIACHTEAVGLREQ